MTTSMNGDVKSIPIRCLIEVKSSEKSCSTSTGSSVQPETESFAIVPSNSLFRDVVKTVLGKLGYSPQDAANAKGAVQIKNWRALDLEQVTDNALVSVEDMLGDLTTVATLRIKITSKGKSEDVKDKLLLMLLEQSYEVLIRRGCPIAKDELEKVVAGHGEFNSAKQADFYSWYGNNLSNCKDDGEHYDEPRKIQKPSPLTIPSPPKPTRLRITFDSEEVCKLQQWFEIDPHPSRQQMTKYLSELKDLSSRSASQKPIDLTNIMYWFKNARAAARRQGRSVTSEDLSEDEGQSERETTSLSAPPLPNSNAVYVIKDPLVDDKVNPMAPASHSEESDLEEELSVADSDMDASEFHQSHGGNEATDGEVRSEGDMQSKNATTPHSTSSSPKLPSNLMNGGNMASRLPGYPFPYGALPMAYLQTQIHPFYKDWSEKFQSAVAQAQANTAAQQTFTPTIKHENMIKQECELSKAERQKRHRAFIDPVSEIPKLEQWFTKDTHPSHYVIEQICDDLNRGEFRSRYPKLSPKNIQLWFKNHRAKVKRMRVGGGSLSFVGVGSPQMSPPSGLALSMME